VRDWKHYAIAALLVIVAFGGYELLRARDARLTAEIQSRVLEHDREHLAQDAADAKAREKQSLEQIAADKKKPATVEQVVKYIPTLAPFAITRDGGIVKLDDANSTLPDAPSSIPSVLPVGRDGLSRDVKPSVVFEGDPEKVLGTLRDFGADCAQCKVSLEARDQQLKDAQAEIENLKQQRDTYKRGMKGSFWRNLKHDAIVIGVSASTAYLIGRASH
jgi:hypothetical protein